MKHLIVVFTLLLAFTAFSFAQLDSLKVTKTYAGILYTGSYNSELTITHEASIRVGGDFTAPLFESIELGAWAGYDFSPSSNSVFGKFVLSKDFGTIKIAGGFMPRPITLIMRPMPLTSGGHFEPPAIAAIPGVGTGLAISRQFANGPFIQVGSYYLAPHKKIEWNACLEQKTVLGTLKLGGFASTVRKGIAAGVECDEMTLKWFVANDKVTTGFVEYRAKWFAPYVTANYNKYSRSFDHLELGWTKVYQGPNGIQTLVGMGWQYHSKLTNLYVQVYL
ncbi:MAG: hypothetical protein WC575_00440 [Patescibacteria group bacterium]